MRLVVRLQCAVRGARSHSVRLDAPGRLLASTWVRLRQGGEALLETPPSLPLSLSIHPSIIMLLLYNSLLSLLESIYRRGARRWRKLYRVNGHLFQAKRFNRVSVVWAGLLSHCWLTNQIETFVDHQTHIQPFTGVTFR